MARDYDLQTIVDMINEVTDDWYAETDGEYITFYNQNVEEDYFEEIDAPDNLDALLHDVYNRYDYFDPDEHVEEWIRYKNEGVSGVPSVRELIKEADTINDDLHDLYFVIKSVIEGYEDSIEE